MAQSIYISSERAKELQNLLIPLNTNTNTTPTESFVNKYDKSWLFSPWGYPKEQTKVNNNLSGIMTSMMVKNIAVGIPTIEKQNIFYWTYNYPNDEPKAIAKVIANSTKFTYFLILILLIALSIWGFKKHKVGTKRVFIGLGILIAITAATIGGMTIYKKKKNSTVTEEVEAIPT